MEPYGLDNAALQTLFNEYMAQDPGRLLRDENALRGHLVAAAQAGGMPAVYAISNRLEPLLGRERLLELLEKSLGIRNPAPSVAARGAPARAATNTSAFAFSAPPADDQAKQWDLLGRNGLLPGRQQTLFDSVSGTIEYPSGLEGGLPGERAVFRKPRYEPAIQVFDFLGPEIAAYGPGSPEAEALQQGRLQRNSLYENVLGPGGAPTPGGLNHGYPTRQSPKGLPGGRVSASYYQP